MRFSDEKRFSLYNDGPIKRWMQSGDKFRAGYSRQTNKARVSIMVWLAIAADGRSRLVLCDDRQASQSYITTVLEPSKNFIRSLSRAGNTIVFQQDNASSHVSRRTLRWLAARRVNILQWPAISPDLNLVEHCWTAIARNMVGKSYASKEELWEGVKAAWAAVPPSFVHTLYGSMVRRLTAVVVARGGNTRY